MKPELGQTASRSLTLTAEHVKLYAQITGDRNPLHFDEDFTSKTKFGRLVVQGGITSGLLNALVAEDLPGPGTVFMSQELKYPAPVYIGDTITALGEVLEVHPKKPVTHMKFTISRQDGEVVLEATAWCYTFSPEA